MSTAWKDDYLRFDLPYWVIRDDGEGDRCGSIHFDIGCQKIASNGERYTLKEIMDILEKKCKVLINKLAKQNSLSFVETLDMVAHGMYNHSVNMATIETDDERELKVVDQQKKNKEYFDKYSD